MRNEEDLLRLSMQLFAEDTTAEEEQDSGSADESLRTAYAMYENEMLRCRLAILSQNHGTAVKSPGSLLSEDGDTAEDPFLQGLFGERA